MSAYGYAGLCRAVEEYTGCQEPDDGDFCVQHLDPWPCIAGRAVDAVIRQLANVAAAALNEGGDS